MLIAIAVVIHTGTGKLRNTASAIVIPSLALERARAIVSALSAGAVSPIKRMTCFGGAQILFAVVCKTQLRPDVLLHVASKRCWSQSVQGQIANSLQRHARGCWDPPLPGEPKCTDSIVKSIQRVSVC